MGCNEDKIEDLQVQDVRKEPGKIRKSSAEPVQQVKVSHCTVSNSIVKLLVCFRHS